jgi:hypothetical protein
MCVCAYVYMYVRMYACIYVWKMHLAGAVSNIMCAYICMHECMYVCMHERAYVCMYICMENALSWGSIKCCVYVCMFICIYVCVYTFMYVLKTH